MKFLNTIIFASASLMFVACGEDDDDGDGGNPEIPALGTQIDRTGRPAISTALIEAFSGDETAKGNAKDDYNGAAPSAWSGFTANIAGSLAILDSLDTDCGNQLLAGDTAVAGRYDGLAGVLADDQLYVNADSGECGTYLGLEAEVTEVLPAGDGGCGGRTLTDDIIARSYSVLSGVGLSEVDDTITEDGDCAQSNTAFPFVCAPL